jgi:nucleoside-diphosphate-sugar epimerase
VTGTTRSAAKADSLARAGATPTVVDVYDVDALTRAMQAARPEVVVHQLTDLPDEASALKPEALAANARVRIEGTHNLLLGAKAAGATRMIAQSISFIYAPGPEPHSEGDALAPPDNISARGVHALEGAVTGTPGLAGIVLRYGRLYGPGTWVTAPTGKGFLHVDAAAQAAVLAITRGAPGIYNIAEDDGEVAIGKARRELGFDPGFRAAIAG